jgi:hypothetical protein
VFPERHLPQKRWAALLRDRMYTAAYMARTSSSDSLGTFLPRNVLPQSPDGPFLPQGAVGQLELPAQACSTGTTRLLSALGRTDTGAPFGWSEDDVPLPSGSYCPPCPVHPDKMLGPYVWPPRDR